MDVTLHAEWKRKHIAIAHLHGWVSPVEGKWPYRWSVSFADFTQKQRTERVIDGGYASDEATAKKGAELAIHRILQAGTGTGPR